MATPGHISQAQQKLARSLQWGLAAMGLFTLLGPVLSYRIDSDEVERQLRARGTHEARTYADSLSLRLLTMESELRRIARRPEVDLSDQNFEPEKILLKHTHEQSALFGGGVMLLDLNGRVVSATPQEPSAKGGDYAGRRWFQRALSSNRGIVDRTGDETDGWVVIVPVLGGQEKTATVGFLAGIARAADQPLSFNLDPAQEVLVVDGEDILFQVPNGGAVPTALVAYATEARGPEGVVLDLDGTRYLAFAAKVRGTLDLWLLNVGDKVIAPIRARLFKQLVFLIAVQFFTWLAFSAYVRRTYLAFRAMETRVTEEERMANLGRAASLIAHEVKNSLNSLTAAASFEASGSLSNKVARGQLARLSHLARSLLSLGRPLKPQLARVLLSDVVKETVEGLKLLPESADVQTSLALDAPATIEADPTLVATAIDNVVRNAIEAAVAAKDTGKTSEPRVQVTVAGAALTVEDNGGGPPPGFEAHAFEPFVTSKPKGVGLGLTTARQAIEASGGTLRFERIPGGTRFVLTFKPARTTA